MTQNIRPGAGAVAFLRTLADESIDIRGGYPAEKPAVVSEVLIRQSSSAGDLVVDPFTGSASTGVAALGQGRHFLGTDVCREAVGIARRRLLEAGGHADEGLLSSVLR